MSAGARPRETGRAAPFRPETAVGEPMALRAFHDALGSPSPASVMSAESTRSRAAASLKWETHQCPSPSHKTLLGPYAQLTRPGCNPFPTPIGSCEAKYPSYGTLEATTAPDADADDVDACGSEPEGPEPAGVFAAHPAKGATVAMAVIFRKSLLARLPSLPLIISPIPRVKRSCPVPVFHHTLQWRQA